MSAEDSPRHPERDSDGETNLDSLASQLMIRVQEVVAVHPVQDVNGAEVPFGYVVEQVTTALGQESDNQFDWAECITSPDVREAVVAFMNEVRAKTPDLDTHDLDLKFHNA